MAEKVPRLLPGVDIRKFKLDATDGFLLTRVDGRLGPKELSRDTGLPDFSIARALEKLEKLGVIEIVDPNAPPRAPPPPPAPERKAAAQFDGGLGAPKYDPKELEEEADLTPEQKKRVLDFYYRLEDLDHYTLLGITKESDKKGVKRAYFELAALFHPDRYFKKQLGTFKPKMEVLFNRITEAHDTLVDAAKRADYDGYLAEVATTRGMEAMLERAMAESAHAAEQAATQQAATHPGAGVAPASQPTSVPTPVSVPAGPSPEELQRRREALARRLMGGAGKGAGASRPSPTEAAPPPPPPRVQSTHDAMEALKRRYHDRLETATQAHAARYVAAAEDALAKNDLVAAATSLSIATKFAPEDQALAVRAQEVKNLADKALTESYLKQALYEEKQGHWTEASKSWVKVAKLRNDAGAHERSANAIWRSADGDLRAAADHAKAAITLEPANVVHHVTLAEVYLKAGLASSAKRALEAAQRLDPQNPAVQGLLKRTARL